MFDFLFGWRNASKCKSLIRKVQCRLKLVKNKRCWIVKQLRQDVAELLKNGHHQTAFERVEQLLKDESMVEVYDLVGSFCEFIIMNLGYIRKHKDCPNDINEAVSTLIFTSARLGDLPELLLIRKVFGERYGLSFVTASLELRPGNLVNNQIKENLIYTKKVSDDVKYKLLDEIASSCVEPGPLLLEYKTSESLEDPETKSNTTQNSRSDQIQTDNNNDRICNITTESEGKIVHIDFQSERLRDQKIFPNAIQSSVPDENKILGKRSKANETESLSSSSSSETSSRLPDEEMIYLDDIEEFAPPATKNGHVQQDQRLFTFKSFEIPSKEKTEYVSNAISFKGQMLLQNEKNSSRSPRMSENPSRKRTRRRSSVSQENIDVTDAECELYYGISHDASTAQENESHYHQREEKKYKILMDSFDQEGGNCERSCYITVKSSINLVKCGYDSMGFVWRCNSNANISTKCAVEHPHCFYIRDKNESLEHLSSTTKTKDCSMQSTNGAKIEHGPDFCKNSIICKAQGEARNEAQLPCLRAMTMPTGRPDEIATDNMFRSNSFPFESPRSCRHIHPKLPDYDELAAKFMALKQENLQNKNRTNKPVI